MGPARDDPRDRGRAEPARDDGVDLERWNASHAVSSTPTFSRIKRATICADLPDDVEPTTLWPSWPLAEVAARLQIQPAETIVDLACGRGEVGLWIARHLDAAWVGVDPSPVGLAIAARRVASPPAGGAGRPTRLVEGHFLATGLDDHCADAVLVVDALHFAVDLPATLAEVRRTLRPGRRLVIVGPHMLDPHPALAAAGFDVECDEATPRWRERMDEFLDRVRAEADTLRAELGEATASLVFALDARRLADVTHRLIAARAPSR